ncbi:hypothetical protein KUTeg_008491 [Tegillarca granosa]|uniref:Uncharacterized protein n=1 Tax=Tegillarca granosa TaxID=220873 RepID=A0ABQ9FCC9_TEGGR|nr:hypothetical protein KUTeg_008491 [Tegillarca granosa]
MAGFSVSMSKNGRRLLFGAPGAFYWQGQVYSKWSDEGGLLHKTREGPASQDDSYLGYSSAVGEFDGDGEEDINILLSLLVIHTQNVCLSQIGVIIMFIEIFQLGAYFGYSVAVQDLDGNKLDDIIVGAPLYSDYSSKHTYDAGRVYIYYQNNKSLFHCLEFLSVLLIFVIFIHFISHYSFIFCIIIINYYIMFIIIGEHLGMIKGFVCIYIHIYMFGNML